MGRGAAVSSDDAPVSAMEDHRRSHLIHVIDRHADPMTSELES